MIFNFILVNGLFAIELQFYKSFFDNRITEIIVALYELNAGCALRLATEISQSLSLCLELA